MIRWLLLLLPTVAAAQERSLAHLEGCLVWSSGPSGGVSAYNECSRPLTLLFMAFDEQVEIRKELAPGARFNAGPRRGFMFTACPVGSEPSLRFALENKEPISVSLYNCVIGRPVS